MKRLTRSSPLILLTIDNYARRLIEQKEERRRHLSLLYEKLDRDTRKRYVRQYHHLEKRANDFQDRVIAQIFIRNIYYVFGENIKFHSKIFNDNLNWMRELTNIQRLPTHPHPRREGINIYTHRMSVDEGEYLSTYLPIHLSIRQCT